MIPRNTPGLHQYPGKFIGQYVETQIIHTESSGGVTGAVLSAWELLDDDAIPAHVRGEEIRAA